MTFALVILAVVAIVGAWKMIFSHHPIHSALYLVLNLCASAVIYLLLGAQFIAVVQVAVYAGAIMVLFLFIIMYLNLGLARDRDDAPGRRVAAIAAPTLLALLVLAGGLAQWTGAVAGLTPGQLKVATQAAEQGKASLPGKPAGTPDAARDLQAGRVNTTAWQPTSVEEIGLALFGGYALPFEIASLLLLVAMIGALIIARPQIHHEQRAAQEARGQ